MRPPVGISPADLSAVGFSTVYLLVGLFLSLSRIFVGGFVLSRGPLSRVFLGRSVRSGLAGGGLIGD